MFDKLKQNHRLFYHLLQLLLFLIIFSTPINLFYQLPLGDAYVNGFFIDYLVPKIYLHDLFMVGFIATTGFYLLLARNPQSTTHKPRTTNHKPTNPQLYKLTIIIALILFFFLITRQLFSTNITASVYWLAKIIEIVSFGWLLNKVSHTRYKSQTTSLKTTIKLGLISTIIFQTSLAIYQFHFQKNLLPYKYLGETQLTRSIGLAKANICGRETVLAYGTTAHPNILAGVMVIYAFLFILLTTHQSIPTKNQLTNSQTKKSSNNSTQSRIQNFELRVNPLLIFIPIVFTIALTISLSACLGLIFGAFGLLVIKYRPNWIKWLLVGGGIFFLLTPLAINKLDQVYPHYPSISRRNLLNLAAIKMWQHYPVFGVGLDQFTIQAEQFSQSTEIVRFPQPTHHIGLLFLAETGLLGVLLLGLSLVILDKYKPITKPALSLMLLVLMPLASLDHWLITQPVGLFVIGLIISSSPSATHKYQ